MKNQINMKEFILLIRLPQDYGSEQALAVREQWNALTGQWKADGTFVTSFVFPSKSYVISENGKVTNEQVIANGRRIISCIVVKAPDIDAALSLGKKCPVLAQNGTVEVREVQPRPLVTENS